MAANLVNSFSIIDDFVQLIINAIKHISGHRQSDYIRGGGAVVQWCYGGAYCGCKCQNNLLLALALVLALVVVCGLLSGPFRA